MTLQENKLEKIMTALHHEPQLMSSSRVMAILDISRATLYRLISENKLERLKEDPNVPSSTIKFPKESVARYILSWS